MASFEGTQGNGNGHARESGAGFGQRVDQIGSSAHQLWDEAREAVQDLNHTLDLRGRVERNPYAMLLAAAGVGYLLGGGLFTSTTARLVRMGMKLAAVPLVKDELLHMAEAAMQGFAAGAGSGRGPGSDSSGNPPM